MEIQLQELIEQIKKNGVEVAEGEASSIINSAKAEAEKIVADAKQEAEKILDKAKKENDRLVQVSEDSIRQAGRNLLITLRESVAKELDAVVKQKVAEAYSKQELAGLIAAVVSAWAKNPEAEDISVLLNQKDLEQLEASLLSALKENMLSGVTLKPNNTFSGGFRISVNNGTAYYDYSAEAVTEMLSAYLNPRVTALMKEAEGV